MPELTRTADRWTMRQCISLILSMLLGIAAVGAGGAEKSKNPRKHDKANVDVGVTIFVGSDKTAIREYIGGLPSDGLPPGLAKRDGALPPGLEKQLRKNGQLPPGLQKKIRPCPAELERRLSPLAPGLKRGFIAGRVILYNEKTSAVLDIFYPF